MSAGASLICPQSLAIRKSPKSKGFGSTSLLKLFVRVLLLLTNLTGMEVQIDLPVNTVALIYDFSSTFDKLFQQKGRVLWPCVSLHLYSYRLWDIYMWHNNALCWMPNQQFWAWLTWYSQCSYPFCWNTSSPAGNRFRTCAVVRSFNDYFRVKQGSCVAIYRCQGHIHINIFRISNRYRKSHTSSFKLSYNNVQVTHGGAGDFVQ